jgi:hypothetical protein
MMPGYRERSETDYPLYFRQMLDDTVYRLRSAGAPFELRERDGSWRPVLLSEQDWDHLIYISEHEAVAVTYRQAKEAKAG